MKNVIIVCLLFLSQLGLGFASPDIKELKMLENQAQNYIKIYEKESQGQLEKSSILINKSGIDRTSFMSRQQELLKNAYQGANPKKISDQQILVFISFSMPDKAIIELLQEADRSNAVLLTQGLIENSFPKTLNKIASLVKAAGNKAGLQIDPNLFIQYKIKMVPAYVLRVDNNDFHIVYGSSSIQDALSEFRAKGFLKNV